MDNLSTLAQLATIVGFVFILVMGVPQVVRYIRIWRRKHSGKHVKKVPMKPIEMRTDSHKQPE